MILPGKSPKSSSQHRISRAWDSLNTCRCQEGTKPPVTLSTCVHCHMTPSDPLAVTSLLNQHMGNILICLSSFSIVSYILVRVVIFSLFLSDLCLEVLNFFSFLFLKSNSAQHLYHAALGLNEEDVLSEHAPLPHRIRRNKQVREVQLHASLGLIRQPFLSLNPLTSNDWCYVLFNTFCLKKITVYVCL